MSPSKPSLRYLWFPRTAQVSHRVLMTVLPCDPVTSSHHPARSHCLTCTGSISRALDVPSSSREQSGTSATPSNYPHSKTSKAKLACAAAPSTDNARHLNRVFLLCQHFHCQPVQWPRQGGPTDPRPCQTDTPPAPALRISILKDIPPWFRGSHLRLWKAVTVSPARLSVWLLSPLRKGCMIASIPFLPILYAWRTQAFLPGLRQNDPLAGLCSSLVTHRADKCRCTGLLPRPQSFPCQGLKAASE